MKKLIYIIGIISMLLSVTLVVASGSWAIYDSFTDILSICLLQSVMALAFVSSIVTVVASIKLVTKKKSKKVPED